MRTIPSQPTAEIIAPMIDQHEAQTSRAYMLREMRYTGVLKHVAEDLAKLESALPHEHRLTAKRLQREVGEVLETDSMAYVEQIMESMHDGYLRRLAQDFPTLTPTELRMAAFLRLPMPSKEIASMFSCSVRSVEKHRERMRKKFHLAAHESLTMFLASRV
jgi:DNA-binding CsgD family transcriptional regulator